MATTLPTDVLYSNSLPLEIVTAYSRATELENRPKVAYENAEWMEEKSEFREGRTDTVSFETYRGINPAVEKLLENEDKDSLGYTSFRKQFSVDEYGIPMQWSRRAETFHYSDPSLQDKIRNIVGPNMVETQDALMRNAMIDGLTAAGRVTYLSGSGLDDIPSNAYIGTELVSEIGEYLLEDNNNNEGEVVCLGQRRAFWGITRDANWQDIKKYANPQDLVKGEEGSWHNVRFARAALGKLPNYGAVIATTTLVATANREATYITVADTTGFAANQVVTIGTPGGKDETAEEVRIASVNAQTGRLTIANDGGLRYKHDIGDDVTEAQDLYPLIFIARGIKPWGKGTVVPAYIGVTPPTDKMGRIHTVFWYAILGYGTLRPWGAWLVWVSAPPYELLGV